MMKKLDWFLKVFLLLQHYAVRRTVSEEDRRQGKCLESDILTHLAKSQIQRPVYNRQNGWWYWSVLNSGQYTWWMTKHQCEDMRGHMVTTFDSFTTVFLRQRYGAFWMGVQELEVFGHLAWYNRTPITPQHDLLKTVIDSDTDRELPACLSVTESGGLRFEHCEKKLSRVCQGRHVLMCTENSETSCCFYNTTCKSDPNKCLCDHGFTLAFGQYCIEKYSDTSAQRIDNQSKEDSNFGLAGMIIGSCGIVAALVGTTVYFKRVRFDSYELRLSEAGRISKQKIIKEFKLITEKEQNFARRNTPFDKGSTTTI